MKKLTLFTFLIIVAQLLQAQTKTDSTKTESAKVANGKNEIKLNLLMGVLGIPEINYERIIADDQSIGLAVLFGIDNEVSDYNFGAIPYYRVYFGSKKASGFFIEANAAVLSLEDYEYEMKYNSFIGYYNSSVKKNVTAFGLGAAAGGKFLTKSGFIGEAYFGLGRIFGKSTLEAYPRIGITIGKRF